METLSYAKGLGRMNLPSISSGSWDGTGFEYGRKCDNSYSYEVWFATPFAIIFLVDISEISTKSGPNTTRFGGLVCVIWYTNNKFAAKEST